MTVRITANQLTLGRLLLLPVPVYLIHVGLVKAGGFPWLMTAFVLFVVLFRFLPETEVTWREASVSALVSTVLFGIGSVLVTMYVHHKKLGDLYAGASAIVVAVLWVYYSAQVFFLGACVGAALHEFRADRSSSSDER